MLQVISVDLNFTAFSHNEYIFGCIEDASRKHILHKPGYVKINVIFTKSKKYGLTLSILFDLLFC